MTLICDFFPSWFSVCCASIISTILFLLGGVDIPLIWLFIFVVIDYLSGSWYAIKSGNWSSSVGGKGIIKKIIIFLMVVIANGIDQSTGINYIRQAVIIAYLINESGLHYSISIKKRSKSDKSKKQFCDEISIILPSQIFLEVF